MKNRALTKYREEKGLTLEAFGKLVGASKGTVSKWENGAIPRPAFMQRIVAATGAAITPSDWYVGEPAE